MSTSAYLGFISYFASTDPYRPLFVRKENGKVWIIAHDHYHLQREHRFRQEIFRSHPDRNRRRGASERTRELIGKHHKWEVEEEKWYAQFNLKPPRKCPAKNRREDKHPERPLLIENAKREERNVNATWLFQLFPSDHLIRDP